MAAENLADNAENIPDISENSVPGFHTASPCHLAK